MILVTGGAGFIGSVLVKELNLLGREDIIIVDRLAESQKWANLVGLKYQEYFQCDEFLTNFADDVMNSVSFIFHIGACSATTELDMDYLMRNNVDYSRALFELATQHDIPFVYASSAATYGDGEKGYSDEHSKISELSPLNRYGYSKQLVDEWILKQPQKPTQWFGLKFFNVYGPNEYHKGDMRSLVHKAYGQILESGKVQLFKSHREGYEDGKQLRDFIYVKDIARAMIEMMNPSSANFSGIYNLGTGSARSFLDLMKATFKAMGKEENIEFIDMPMRFRNQYQYYTQADMTKFKEFLPHFKFTTLEDGVEDYVKNYLVEGEKHF
ncbi:ADP-L-Glycero-D-mannoheptose-6-epimerase [Halobacteriovorax marinus SJ]|uniref:ADP-L-glycero-D-manno-heptose-6-epimerase n=1 Tax=Halobacteriovorax marinus (strain ATCC BAA-682 / DSM 15412 / SJ) TaxID=862908 RepID=E1X466_HALMS|nr:ADP-glyceromanno-heptose 6-epimerase [Halobacteriovorax marinus]CBW27038.1 ADP-L-Glycero-D-mannoheptose-6-epimerase [Halobacteriovorax marinus SJ]